MSYRDLMNDCFVLKSEWALNVSEIAIQLNIISTLKSCLSSQTQRDWRKVNCFRFKSSDKECCFLSQKSRNVEKYYWFDIEL